MENMIAVIFVTIIIIIGTNSVNLGEDQIKIKNAFCEDSYENMIVKVAFPMGDYMVFIADMKSDKNSGQTYERQAFRVYRGFEKDHGKQTIPFYYDANTIPTIEEIDKQFKIGYVFTTTNMEPIFKKNNQNNESEQRSNQIHYFVSNKTLSSSGNSLFEVFAAEFDYIKRSDNKEPTFKRVNWKPVYNSSEPDRYNSGFLNLRQLFGYFPKEIVIESLFILENILFYNQTNYSKRQYFAVVYTTEKYYFTTKEESTIQMRHYLRGVPVQFGNPDGNFYRLVWDLDKSLDKEKACTRLTQELGTAALESTTKIKTMKTIGFSHQILEFSSEENNHKKVVVEIDQNGRLTWIENQQLHSNNLYLKKCESHPPPEVIASSDCRQNPLFSDSDAKEEMQSLDENQSSYGMSQTIFLISSVFATIVAIIGLVTYKIYTVVSSDSLY